MKEYGNTQRGFTIIELMVAVTLFAFVAVTMIGAMLAVVDGNRKARATVAAMDNLNFALESMSREIRVGSSYDCSGLIKTTPSETGDCANGSPILGILSSNNDVLVYRFNAAEGSIERCGSIGTSCPDATDDNQYIRMTGSNVVIDRLTFHTQGSGSADNEQPRVTMIIEGTAGDLKANSGFSIQTTVTQRFPDF